MRWLLGADPRAPPADDPAYDRRFEMSTMDRNELVKGGKDLVAQAAAAGKTQQGTLAYISMCICVCVHTHTHAHAHTHTQIL